MHLYTCRPLFICSYLYLRGKDTMQDDYRCAMGFNYSSDGEFNDASDLNELDWLRKNMLFKQDGYGRPADNLQLIMLDNY